MTPDTHVVGESIKPIEILQEERHQYKHNKICQQQNVTKLHVRKHYDRLSYKRTQKLTNKQEKRQDREKKKQKNKKYIIDYQKSPLKYQRNTIVAIKVIQVCVI